MTETIRCVCGRLAVCRHKAGLGVFFVRADGTTYKDLDADCYLCGDCCGHSGEEGPCYRITDGVPMSEADFDSDDGGDDGGDDGEWADPEDLPLGDDVDMAGCRFPGACLTPGPHPRSECHAADMLEGDRGQAV